MMILKFGGTSVGTAAQLSTVANIVKERRRQGQVSVVVSACGHTTDVLATAIEHAVAGRSDACGGVLEALKTDHFKLIEQATKGKYRTRVRKSVESTLLNVASYLSGVLLLRECSLRARDFIVGHGELLSSQIVAAVLSSHGIPSQGVDARGMIVTDDAFGAANIDHAASTAQLRKQLAPLMKTCVPVVTGFLGATKEGIPTTIGRGGSDLSATFIGAVLKAKRVEIWTDVEGVLSADPGIVPEAFTLPQLNYAETMELAFFGARVLHAKAVAPLAASGIPLLIKNTRNPDAPGTLVSCKTGPGVVKGITSIQDISLITLEGSGIVGLKGTAGRMFSSLARRGVNAIMISMASSEQSVCCAVATPDAASAVDELRSEFELEFHRGQVNRIRRADEKMIVAVVGEGMRGTPGVAGRLFSALGRNRVDVSAVAQGSSEINISFVIDAADKVRALNLIHGAFHLSSNRINLFIFGKGNIGGRLFDQIAEQREALRETMGLDLRVVGVADSRNFVFDRTTLDATRWRKQLQVSRRKADGRAIVELLRSSGLENIIVVDATASEKLPDIYCEILGSGMCIVTPNKKANTLPMKRYREIMAGRNSVRARYLYETTVGAGLPIITTLHDLIDSGDRVRKIQGVFSGTMSYIFSKVAQGASFSEAVASAREMGFTEPDPRDDLCGADVARKLLILAREMGYSLELRDVKVESLVPPSMRKLPLPDFLKRIGTMDSVLEKPLAEANAENKVLQYCGKLEGGRVVVGITKVPKSSPLARMKPGDNMVIFTTDRYLQNPLIVQGPGAGPDVTAGGVFADILRISQHLLR